MNDKIKIVGKLDFKGWHEKAKEVTWGGQGIMSCIHCQSNNLLQKVMIVYEDDNRMEP